MVLVGYPFDLLKVRLQTAQTPVKGLLRKEIIRIWARQGLCGFYQGATAPFLAVTPIFAANFYGYELGKRVYARLNGHYQEHEQHREYSFGGGISAAHCAFAAAFSALQTALVVIPAERIKVMMQTPLENLHPAYRNRNAIQVGIKMLQDGGLRSLYRGGAATLLRDVPGLATFFTTYEHLKEQLRPSPDAAPHSLPALMSVMLAGGLAGMTSWMISLPVDVIKSRMQAKVDLDGGRLGMATVLKRLLLEEGPRGLYRGLAPVLLRAFPANAACFLGYELTKTILTPLPSQSPL